MWLVLLALLAQSTDFLAQGNQALDAKQYDRAIELFTKATADDPKDYGAEFQLALTYGLVGRDADAVPHYQSALRLRPGLYEAALNLGLSLQRLRKPAEAIPHLQAAAAERPREFRPAFYLAQALAEMKDDPEAEAAFRNALSIDERSAAAESGLGMALARQGRLDDAAPHFRQAFTLDRTYRSGFVELAARYEAAHRTEEAIAIYREFPDNTVAQEHLGVLLMAQAKLAEAIPALEEAVAKGPTQAGRIALAQAYAKNKQPEKAQVVAAQAVEAAPGDLDLRLFYARLLRDQHKFPQAIAQFLAAAQMKPDSADAWSELAGIYVVTEQYPQTLAALDRLKALGAEGVGNFFYRALAYDHLKQLPEAVESYKRFLAGAQGKFPDQEFQARQRVRTLELEIKKR